MPSPLDSRLHNSDHATLAILDATPAGSGACSRRAVHAPAAHDVHRPAPFSDAREERDVWSALARMLRAREDARRLHPSYAQRWERRGSPSVAAKNISK